MRRFAYAVFKTPVCVLKVQTYPSRFGSVQKAITAVGDSPCLLCRSWHSAMLSDFVTRAQDGSSSACLDVEAREGPPGRVRREGSADL